MHFFPSFPFIIIIFKKLPPAKAQASLSYFIFYFVLDLFHLNFHELYRYFGSWTYVLHLLLETSEPDSWER